MQYVLVLDQGTTSSRAILFNRRAQIVSLEQMEFAQHFPQSGWVEHDAGEIWRTQLAVARACLRKAGVSPDEVAAIGVTNQRETTVLWDRQTGEPIAPAIVWQDRRTDAICETLRSDGAEPVVNGKTGLRLDPYFSATKILWLLDAVPGARARAERGEILFGTIDSWLIWNLTGGAVHATDITNASRTLLCDIKSGQWDDELLQLFNIPAAMLPQIVPSSGVIGETAPSLFGYRIPIAGAAGDQQAATFGQACFEKGETKNTYGTGGFLLMNAGDKPVFSKNGLVTTIGWGLNGKITYVLEGSVFVAGAAIQWLRDELHLVDSASDTEYFAGKVPDANGCYVVPAFTGLGAPYWDQYARGTIVGLTRGVNKYHVIRATLESLAYQVNDVLEVMKEDAGSDLAVLRVDLGARPKKKKKKIQANISNVAVERPECIETTALGAAYLAGLAVGFWESKEAVLESRNVERIFRTQIDDAKRNAMVKGWRAAVGCSRDWIKKIQ